MFLSFIHLPVCVHEGRGGKVEFQLWSLITNNKWTSRYEIDVGEFKFSVKRGSIIWFLRKAYRDYKKHRNLLCIRYETAWNSKCSSPEPNYCRVLKENVWQWSKRSEYLLKLGGLKSRQLFWIKVSWNETLLVAYCAAVFFSDLHCLLTHHSA